MFSNQKEASIFELLKSMREAVVALQEGTETRIDIIARFKILMMAIISVCFCSELQGRVAEELGLIPKNTKKDQKDN